MLLSYIARQYSAFFERNLLERIVIYACLSSVLVKLIFELILGQWGFIQSQNKQWFFYSFLLMDYVIGYKKLLNFRITLNPQSAFSLLIVVMIAHGLLVGLYMHNQPFVIVNDMIPLLMIALNILRMQSSAEGTKPLDCFRLLKDMIVLLGLASFFSVIADALGRPAQLSLDQSTIFYPLLFAVICTRKDMPKWVMGAAGVLVIMSLTDLNRTTLMFMVLAFSIYMFIVAVKSPVRILGLISLGFLIICSAVLLTPEESKTYQRIAGFSHINTEERTGAVGERWAERDAIQAKLDRLGLENQLLGLGFGGLYDVAFTHEYKEDYGHAHFSWVWFNLRFGMIGQVYLFLMVSLFVFNIFTGFRYGTTGGYFIAFLGLISVLYCVTYVNAVFLMSGIQFFYLARLSSQRGGHDGGAIKQQMYKVI